MKKYLALLLCSLMLFGCSQSPTTDTENSAEEETATQDLSPIVMGAIGPLTGDAAVYGIMDQNVTALKVEQLNAAGGINGRMVEVIWEDGKCTPAEASKAAQKLVSVNKVDIILGAACSGETLAAAPITEKAKVILFSAVSSSPEVTDAGDFVFRTMPSDSSQAGIMAEYANANFKKIAVINEQTDYAVAVATTFKKHYTGEVVEESFLPTESDFKTRITKLKNEEGLEAIYLIPQSPPKGDILFKQLAEQEMALPLLTNEIMAGNPAVVIKHKEYLSSVGGIVGANFLAPEDSSKYDQLIAQYTERYGENPAFESFVATISDRFDVLVKVLSEVEDVTDTEAIRDGLYGIEGFNDGIIPGLAFDENGDANISFSLVEFDGEAFVPMDQ